MNTNYIMNGESSFIISVSHPPLCSPQMIKSVPTSIFMRDIINIFQQRINIPNSKKRIVSANQQFPVKMFNLVRPRVIGAGGDMLDVPTKTHVLKCGRPKAGTIVAYNNMWGSKYCPNTPSKGVESSTDLEKNPFPNVKTPEVVTTRHVSAHNNFHDYGTPFTVPKHVGIMKFRKGATSESLSPGKVQRVSHCLLARCNDVSHCLLARCNE
uniref:Uncharacterized protein n=1 Tax=Timema bartmani TaxID=61472 RepID=A0A7R9FDW4_9NEOP|nr:unnamed protein product [Timema bartmani]